MAHNIGLNLDEAHHPETPGISVVAQFYPDFEYRYHNFMCYVVASDSLEHKPLAGCMV